jgi:undecaprenyl-diphosphatase
MINDLAVAPSRPAAAGRAAAARWRIACLLTLGAFLGLGLAAFASGILPGDLGVRAELLTEDHSALKGFARWVNLAGTWRVILPLHLVLFLGSRAARERWWLWCAVSPVSGALEHAFKFLVGRPRPSGFSLGYPSGHTTAATAFAVIVIYLVGREPTSPALRLGIRVTAVLMVGLVGWARIVLHAHWPTEVLGGFLLGTSCAAAAAWWDSTRGEARRP